MKAVFDFLVSALPWIAIGLFVACSCVTVKTKKDGKEMSRFFKGMRLSILQIHRRRIDSYMILLIDTTKARLGKTCLEKLEETPKCKMNYEYIDASELNISHCLGCNFCWLKTPGECVIKDDYEPLLKKISKADQVWLITDTRFGFVSYQTKNIVDRVMPLVTMNLHFVNQQMRHIPRYKKNPDWGVIYAGEGDKDYLSKWCERVAINFAGKSLGAYGIDEIEEAVKCMW